MPEAHQISRRTTAGVELWYGNGGADTFRFDARRTAIGCSFPDIERGGHCYAVVAAERTFESRDGKGLSRYVAIIDEALCRGSDQLLATLIALKDRYLSDAVFCPDTPALLSDVLRDTEGLAGYKKERHERECRTLWPSFVDLATTADVRTARVEPGRVQHDLERLLAQTVLDPDTGLPVLDADAKSMPALFVMRELPTTHAAAALLRLADPGPEATALWLAAAGLEDSAPRRKKRLLDDLQPRQGGKYTGY